jgi:maltooligosyltrehalose trehalohydrolase
VRRHVIDNALYWVTEYHVDALRLDAIHGIFDFGTRHVLAELTDAVHAQGAALGRRVHLIAESDLNDPRVVRPTAEHGLGFDAQWADDLHHAIHAALTGERAGYYADFGGAGPVIAALRDPFVGAGAYSTHRDRVHGASAAELPRERFVVCAQNHDQVGNRATGERLAALVGPERQRLAAALVLLSGYVPMLFMGEEYGETAPFQYFVSHGDAALVDAVRDGRRAEFAAFGWGADVPDPAAEETFRRSTLDRARLDQPRHAATRALYRDLLALRRAEPALRPDAPAPRVDGDERAGWATAAFARDGHTIAVAFNLTGAPLRVPLAAPGVARWARVLSTEDERYGGAGDPAPAEATDAATLPAWSATVWVDDHA